MDGKSTLQKTTITAVNALSFYYWGQIKIRLNRNGMRTVFMS